MYDQIFQLVVVIKSEVVFIAELVSPFFAKIVNAVVIVIGPLLSGFHEHPDVD